ncbi:hypothetical protein ARALYDRAFT_904112 [Arabidopsis lyrata subsp. lyrata]|uniref:Hexosyltransferase n=1 Tax=Arabidopsis lyrata subsp. lyrata TaxID=81972 RepID=D7LEJ8_ARALL|nr:hypothetical protein ARALYDRAFT_904112 [Arabidopsis lyrata subsp. lyrata]
MAGRSERRSRFRDLRRCSFPVIVAFLCFLASSTFLSQLHIYFTSTHRLICTAENSCLCWLPEHYQMRLTLEYYLLPAPMRNFPRRENLENPNHYHYALFSDNVLAYPNYKSMLNLLRFYISIIFPKLEKILLLDDDDVVVQKDLTPLWSIDLKGKVNGAVETCGVTFHRLDTYLNFSDQHISDNSERMEKEQHNRSLSFLAKTVGLIMFYNLTLPLERKWHLLGLGYDKEIDEKEIANSAVIHFNGPLKPWKELGVTKYQPYFVGFVCLQNMADILSCYTFLL